MMSSLSLDILSISIELGRYQGPVRHFDDIPATANIYEMPYRALIPSELDGLVVAGRCISGSHEALAAIRVMPPAFALGQAAGTAAAQAVHNGLAPRDVDVAALQERLLDVGAYLGRRLAP